MDEDYGAELAALKEQLAQLNADRAAQKRSSFIDGESSYFGGDRTVTGEIFDRLEQMAPGQLEAMDLAARSGMYEATRDQLNQLSQKLTMAVDNIKAQMSQLQATASQAEAEAQQQVAEMQNTVQALQPGASTESGIPEQTALDMDAGTAMPPMPEMPAEGAPEAPTEGAIPPMSEMPAEGAPTEAPAEEAPTEAAPEAPAEGALPPLPGAAVSDERLKDVDGERKLGGESHGKPASLGGEGLKAKVDAWRKTRQVQCSAKECASTKHSHTEVVSDRRMKQSLRPAFSSGMIAACRTGK